MATHTRLTNLVAVTVALCSSGMLSGCASIRSLTGYAGLAATPSSPLPAPQQRQPPSTNPSLAAVQDFLERTESYDLSAEKTASSRQAADPAPSVISAVPMGIGSAQQQIRFDPMDGWNPDGLESAESHIRTILVAASSAAPGPALPVIERVSIHIATPLADTPRADQARSNTTNQPLGMDPTELPPLTDRFIDRLKTRASQSPDFESEWQLRLAQLASNRDASAGDVSPQLPQEARDLLSALIRVALAVRGAVLDPWLGQQDRLASVDALRRMLSNRLDPSVITVALCKKVITFGVYEEMADDRFVAGRGIPTIVYCEIENFQSEVTDEGRYVTRLRTRLELLTPGGESVWQHEEPEIVDTCRRQRMDFFVAQRITLPPTLPAGDYVLKVFVEDKLSGRAGEAAHPLAIHSALTVATGN